MVHYVMAGSTQWPWEWTKHESEAILFDSAEVAEKFLGRFRHSGLGLAVRRAWRGKLNGT